MAAGCDRHSPTAAKPSGRTAQRIVSLAPALTQMMVDMGLGDRIVGVGQWDMAAPAGLPVVGSAWDLDTEALIALQPSLVVAMAVRGADLDTLRRLSQRHGCTLATFVAPLSVSDVIDMLVGTRLVASARGTPEEPGLGETVGEVRAATLLAARIERQLDAIATLTASLDHPRVLMIIGVNPIVASGSGTAHDELLTVAGGVNAVAHMRSGAPVLDRESLLAAQPEVILLLLPGQPPLQSINADPRLAVLRDLPIPAVRRGQIILLKDPLIQLPSSSMPRVAAAMAQAIHPRRATRIDHVMTDETAMPPDAKGATR